MRKSVLGSIPRKGAPEIENQLQLWHNIWFCVGHEWFGPLYKCVCLCFRLFYFVLISDMDNSGDNGQNHGASMFDRVRDCERQRRINEGLCWWEPYANFDGKVIDKEIIPAGYILKPPSKFRLVLCVRKVSDFGVCQQPIMRVICGSESGENWEEERRKMPVPGCKTLGARFSLGIHASLSRPGLADLTVCGKISLARGLQSCH
jgi:hypothetical protein